MKFKLTQEDVREIICTDGDEGLSFSCSSEILETEAEAPKG